ncbi:MAG: GyrI-like domain-containing protein [Gammaproteobacteria bacterium]|nr:GyrI-like domain-containing protein [Gammaproteobacteria bacterium]MDH5728460.1 GyrI-like domain-containing protein [Gammaproteobacteria bacterium]
MKKIDYKKEFKNLYSAKKGKPELVVVPALNYLAVQGAGAPGDDNFKHAIEALFTLAYTLKFMVKKSELAIDYGVMPLQGLWWAEDMSQFSVEKKQDWLWQIMIMQPELINKKLINQALTQAKQKKPELPLDTIEFIKFKEGKCAQVLHQGPFAEEGPTIQALHQFIHGQGLALRDKHHEIYLNDFNRTAPEKLRTIIRQPVA